VSAERTNGEPSNRRAWEFVVAGLAAAALGALEHANWYGWLGGFVGGASLICAMWEFERVAKAQLAAMEDQDG